VTDNLPEIYSYTDILFEADLNTDIGIFESEIPLFVDTERVKVETAEGAELRKQKETEKNSIETQLQTLFPTILEVINTFRRACRIALFRESIAVRILAKNILACQEHIGIEVNHSLNDLFSSNDTEFLFGAFADISLTTFTGDADLEYSIHDAIGQTVTGVFKNGYHHLRSTDRFSQILNEIQGLIENGWSIEDDVLLISLEFLYSDNYRMAVFNAATLLELVVIKFWEGKVSQLRSGSRREQQKAEFLDKKVKKASYKSQVEKILRIVLPEFIEPHLVTDGTLDRCVTAWNLRNEKLAHLYAQVKGGKELSIPAGEAWNAVSSIISLLANVKSC
jgi:hypothetical protein